VLENSYTVGGPNKVAFTQCTQDDTYEAVAKFGTSSDLDPKLNGSYALVATGPATGTAHSVGCDKYTVNGTDVYPGDGNKDMYDVVEWKIKLKAPAGAKSFSFKYVFFSEEYDDYISTPYNDRFYAILEAKSTNNGEPTVINYTDCREPDKYSDFVCGDSSHAADVYGCTDGNKYCYIAINSAFSDCCWYNNCVGFNEADRTDISGTGYECNGSADKMSDGPTKGSSTGWLQTAWPIDGGEEFTITFHLHDTSDPIFDSEVILDMFQFSGAAEQGTIVVE
jgi:hypothetical protein